MTWTHFWDMHSGGGCKEPPFEHIYIELSEAEARVYFFNRFGHSPDRVTCTCCGEDYSVSACQTLKEATGFQRDLQCVESEPWQPGVHQPDYRQRYLEPGEEVPNGWRRVERYTRSEPQTLAQYEARDDVLVVRASEIDPDMCKGDVPKQGYVWMD